MEHWHKSQDDDETENVPNWEFAQGLENDSIAHVQDGACVSSMTLGPKIFSLQNSKNKSVATRALNEVRNPSEGEIWLPAAQIASMDWFKISQSASQFEIPQISLS